MTKKILSSLVLFVVTLTGMAQNISVSGNATFNGGVTFGSGVAQTAPSDQSPGILKGGQGTGYTSNYLYPSPAPRFARSQAGERRFQINTARGTMDFAGTNLDQWKALLAAHSANLVYTWNTTPSWANGGLGTQYIPTDVETSAACQNVLTGTTTTDCGYKEFWTAMMRHNCPNYTLGLPRNDCDIKYYEVANEFNSNTFYDSNILSRNLTDVTISGTTMTSASGAFSTANDVGGNVSGTNIPTADTVIQSVTNPTTAVLNRSGTNGSSLTIRINKPVSYLQLAEMANDEATIVRQYCNNCTVIGGSVSMLDGYHSGSASASPVATTALGQFMDFWAALPTPSLPDAFSIHDYPSQSTTPPPFPEVGYTDPNMGTVPSTDTNCVAGNTPNGKCRVPIKDMYSTVRAIIDARGWAVGKPIWNTESGYNSPAKLVGATQAVTDQLRQAWAARYVLITSKDPYVTNMWYQNENQCFGTLYGTNGTPTNSGTHDGTCPTDPNIPLGITPTGTAYATVNAWLNGATMDASGPAQAGNLWSLNITKMSTIYKIQWLQNNTTSPSFDSTSYTSTDLNGVTPFHVNSTPLEIRPILFTPISGSVAAPTFSPVAGTYGTTQSVTITCPTSGSVGVYTTDGTAPVAGSTAVGGPVSVAATQTLNATCYGVAGKNNNTSSAAYVISASGNCGAQGTFPSTTPADQTTCGNVAPFPAAPTSPTVIAACGTLAANTKYQLSANVTSSVSTTCFTITGPNTVLDYNGHTVTGFVDIQNDNGLHVYSSAAGAASNCTDDTTHACVYGNLSQSTVDTMAEVDHINIQNSASSTSSARNLFFDYGSVNSGSLSGVVNIKIHNITSMSATGLGSFRIVNLQVQGIAHGTKAFPEFYNNVTTCQSTAAACQGVVAYGTWSAKVHNNKLVNQLANASSSETPRGVICDQTDGCEIYNNWHDAQDGRAFRFRGSNNVNDVNSAHDNYVANVVAGTNGNHVASIHVGDPDTGSEVENVTINHNWIDFTSGLVGMSRSATAITFQDNKINCVSCGGTGTGGLWFLRFSSPAASSVNILRTTVTGMDAPQTSCDASTTSLVCQSGTSSSCTVNNGSC